MKINYYICTIKQTNIIMKNFIFTIFLLFNVTITFAQQSSTKYEVIPATVKNHLVWIVKNDSTKEFSIMHDDTNCNKCLENFNVEGDVKQKPVVCLDTDPSYNIEQIIINGHSCWKVTYIKTGAIAIIHNDTDCNKCNTFFD